MNRRSFFTKSIILGSTLITSLNIPNLVLANPLNKKILNSPLAGNVFYTENNPGRWSKKVKGHLPTFELDAKILEVTTGHEMRGFEHYIIKHVIFGCLESTKSLFLHLARFGSKVPITFTSKDLAIFLVFNSRNFKAYTKG